MVAGAPPSPTLLARLEEFNVRSVHVYGLTETYGPNTLCVYHDGWNELPAEERARLLARQGQQYTTADAIRVVDSKMQDVPRDGTTIGEVVMRGNTVMTGYFANEQATRRPSGAAGSTPGPRSVASRRGDRAARPTRRT